MTDRPQRLRLTPRGRRVLVALGAAALSAPALTALAVPPASPVASRSVVVRPGDSLWSIALGAAPDRDPRDEVADLARLNGLTGDVLVPGQRLRLP